MTFWSLNDDNQEAEEDNFQVRLTFWIDSSASKKVSECELPVSS